MKIHSSRIALLAALAILSAATLAAGEFTEYPTQVSDPGPITIGGDGNVWFVGSNALGRMTPDGSFTTILAPRRPAGGSGITAGPDGNVWFTLATDDTDNGIGRATPGGVVTMFYGPTNPAGIAAGPDGNFWYSCGFRLLGPGPFSRQAPHSVGRITPAGAVTEFFVSGDGAYYAIAAGADGALWFTERDFKQIGRVSTTGAVTEFPIPNPQGIPMGIARGPDGNMWFAEDLDRKIARITPAGAITEFPTGDPLAIPEEIVAGPDGNLWFTQREAASIGRITPDGVVTNFVIPLSVHARHITSGLGCLWFTARDFDPQYGDTGADQAVWKLTTAGEFTRFVIPNSGVVSGALQIVTNHQLPSGRRGRDYSVSLEASGGYGPPYNWRLNAGVLPAGLQLDLGKLVGIPQEIGSFVFDLMVQDTPPPALPLPWVPNSVVGSFILTVVDPLEISTPSSLPAVRRRVPYRVQLSVSGGAPPSVWTALSALPPGLSLTSTGVLSGVPRSVGRYTLRIQVSDADSAGIARDFELEVTGPPVIGAR